MYLFCRCSAECQLGLAACDARVGGLSENVVATPQALRPCRLGCAYHVGAMLRWVILGAI